ncbi:hypothetical protein HETIRDRAFT_321588 [Heterobasidion irregulare TC 32-1]|uniref:Uncharacterized protein n=1 Tax=Heterobasidion irregulare (strain TC 32-1) TaxID=747525 RepID=W4K340_HETIT|nr:uncharacterized protein HETIRDRAFT_321588 [Heterobasidion irregulare TC 32-1]ETW79481.1 hypothetical protein HETIRDRAFT_321588 [Heterobasidion irregulare TC 32-1]
MSVTKNSRIEFLVRTPGKKKLRELRLFYPSNFPADNLQARFNALLKAAKSGAIKQGVIATGLLPFVLAFDVLTFVTGPFEINAVWAASSWTGAARATAITNGVTSSTIALAFVPDARLDPLSYRLDEVCWNRAPRGLVPAPRHRAAADTAKSDLKVDADSKRAGEPGPGPSTPPAAIAPPVVIVAKRGGELAALVLEVLKEQLGGDLSGVETDRRLVAKDLEKMLDKGAKEWVAALKAS